MPNKSVGIASRKRLLLIGMFLALAGGCWAAPRAAAGPLEDGRLTIIHANQSTIIDSNEKPRTGLLKQLKDAGVLVIGRYLARCREDEKGDSRWTKQIIHGGKTETEEADAILGAEFEFGLISIYQYKSDEANGPAKFTKGLGQDPEGRCEITDASQQIRISQSPKNEGKLDSQAAVKQAHVIGQPPNTVIYFGVDYDFNRKDPEQKKQKDGLLEYFRQIKAELHKPGNGYLVGAYGDGDVLELLLGKNDQGERLIDFAWISPSHSFSGNSEFFNTGPWHLAHAQSDNQIGLTHTGTCFEYEYDADIQSKSNERQYVGAWNRSGRYLVPQARTAAIFDQRRFVCNIDGVVPGPVQKNCGSLPTPPPCKIATCFDRFVRIEPSQLGQKTGDVKIDFHDYGRFDGRTHVTSLTRSLAEKPLWWDDPDRPKQNCTCFGSDPQKPCP